MDTEADPQLAGVLAAVTQTHPYRETGRRQQLQPHGQMPAPIGPQAVLKIGGQIQRHPAHTFEHLGTTHPENGGIVGREGAQVVISSVPAFRTHQP